MRKLTLRTTGLQLTTALLIAIGPNCQCGAGENWNQILGPNRNGVAEHLKPIRGWPNNQPTIHWRFSLGDGYAGPVVVDNQVIVFHRIENKERVESIDRESGKPLWKRDFDAYYRGGYNPDNGPRCVPLVVDDKVIVFGACRIVSCSQATRRRTFVEPRFG